MEFEILKKTPIFESLSALGKDIFQPNGIFHWAGRARKEAVVNATIGNAEGLESDIIAGGRNKNIPYYLPEITKFINIEPERLVSYASIPGIPPFRELWKNWIIFKGKKEGNMPSGPIDVTNLITTPVICNGITNGIFLTTRLFLDSGQTIISPNKRWGNYDLIINRQNGIKIESFEFFINNEFNIEGLDKSLRKIAQIQDKIVMILNFPNNPTGYSPKPNEIDGIVKTCIKFCEDIKKPLVILCDDAYEGYNYNTAVAQNSIFYELVNKHNLIIPIKMDGTSKEMLMYGGRIASIVLGIDNNWVKEDEIQAFMNEWENKLKGMIRSTLSNCNHFSQEIMTELLKDGFEKIIESRKKVIDILAKRFNAVVDVYKKYNIPKINMDPVGGGFFVFLNIDGVEADKFADHLLVKYKVGTVPIVKPKENINGIRFAYCSVPDDKIDFCFANIAKAAEDLL